MVSGWLFAPTWASEFFGRARSDASPSRSLDQPSGSRQCACGRHRCQGLLLFHAFAQLTHRFCHSRSSLPHHIGLRERGCGCVCGSVRAIPHTQEIANKSRENATGTCRQSILQAHRGTFEAGDTPQSALCAYTHQCLVCKVCVFCLRAMMAALQLVTSLYGQLRGCLHPLPLNAGGPTATRTRVAMDRKLAGLLCV